MKREKLDLVYVKRDPYPNYTLLIHRLSAVPHVKIWPNSANWKYHINTWKTNRLQRENQTPKVLANTADSAKFNWMYTTEIHGNPLPQRICLSHRTRNDTIEQLWHTHCKDGNRRGEKKKRLTFWESLPTLFYENTKTNEGFSLIAATLNVVNPKFVRESEIEESFIAPRMKRTLPTSVTTPDRRCGQRKITKSKESQKERSGARKSFGTQSSCLVKEDEDRWGNFPRTVDASRVVAKQG